MRIIGFRCVGQTGDLSVKAISFTWLYLRIGVTEDLEKYTDLLEHLEDLQFDLSATETMTYVSFNLLCKQQDLPDRGGEEAMKWPKQVTYRRVPNA
jgi:hypothetical protein